MKCKICGAELKPGAYECEFCGNKDFIPQMLDEPEEKESKPVSDSFKLPGTVRDLSGDETVIVRRVEPIRRKFCRRCGRELNPNGRCPVCDNDGIAPSTPLTVESDVELSGRKKNQKNKINPALAVTLILLAVVLIFATSYLIFFNWMKGETEKENEQATATPAVATVEPIDDSSDVARWEPTGTLAPVTTPQAAPTASPERPTSAPTAAPAEQGDPVELRGGSYKYNTHQKLITEAELDAMDRSEIKIIYNEIYARHGMRFSDSELKAYFESQQWYVPSVSNDDEAEAHFNSMERQNRQIIYNYQVKKGWRS